MKNSAWLIVLALVTGFAWPARAQDATPRFEAYAGYDYTRYNAINDISHVPPSSNVNGNGGSAQPEFNVTAWLGIVGDFAGYAVARNGYATTHQISYLFGPRVSFRGGRFTPFAQVLPGAVWASDAIVLGSKTAFGMTAGGGIDVRVSRHIAVRPLQAEYFLTKFPDGNDNRQNNFRYSAGIVFRFGGARG
jgi:opacity protein-like surface antigen